jgi:DNA-directed RNA polymerase subunit RPC12/RpoP
MMCLTCGYEFLTRVAKAGRIRQCYNCGSTDLLTRREIMKTYERARFLVENTALGITPIYDVFRAIFEESRPFLRKRFRLESVLNFEGLIYRMVTHGESFDEAREKVYEYRRR